jgi:hypothetical protein
VEVFFADRLESYAELIEPEMLVRTKAETHTIERNGFRQRRWCGRFRRKTCIVSRRRLMVNLTVFLFARFRVNGSREEFCDYGIILFETLSEKLHFVFDAFGSLEDHFPTSGYLYRSASLGVAAHLRFGCPDFESA